MQMAKLQRSNREVIRQPSQLLLSHKKNRPKGGCNTPERTECIEDMQLPCWETSKYVIYSVTKELGKSNVSTNSRGCKEKERTESGLIIVRLHEFLISEKHAQVPNLGMRRQSERFDLDWSHRTSRYKTNPVKRFN
ncbi:uncharacterized protein LOC105186231 [Harpegnathos saltator]|uniref:uncharacterized protein LOC105186231 n=1 Tax=Harpegnathos saltator TaxID=610380 RepID=UPI00058D4AFC|nr:uncharacterized protein LOC105186231 [Harpegnathos saltator]XP_025156396.1 uncharacterized protein LOC105186231 [Harpegnathos saltator]